MELSAMRINWDRMMYYVLEGEFDLMSKYLETLPSFLTSSELELQGYLEQQASDLDEEAKYDFYESYQDEFAELGEEFPRLLLNGFIVTWYSFVEQQLIELCHRRKLTITISGAAISIRDRDDGFGS